MPIKIGLIGKTNTGKTTFLIQLPCRQLKSQHTHLLQKSLKRQQPMPLPFAFIQSLMWLIIQTIQSAVKDGATSQLS
jgi:hypothetical protein